MRVGGQRRRGQRTAGDNGKTVKREFRHLFSDQVYAGMAANSISEIARELLPIDRQRRTRRHAAGIGSVQHQRVEVPHLGFQQAVRRRQGIRLEGIAAHQLAEKLGTMHAGGGLGAHFVEPDRHPTAGDLESRLGTGQTAANHRNGAGIHGETACGSAASGDAAASSGAVSVAHVGQRRVTPFLVRFSRRYGAAHCAQGCGTGRCQVVNVHFG